MSIKIKSYHSLTKNDEIIKTEFKIENCITAFANSIRRILLSNIPIVAFDDTWHNDPQKRNILIHKNTSAIHNEFLSHRISLLPIYMQSNHHLKISTILNKSQSIRKFQFKDKNNVPIFYLKMKNNTQTRLDKNIVGSIEVFSNDFTVKNTITDIEEDIHTYIKPDPYTNDYCIIDLLKSNILNDDEGEEIDLEAKPTIGLGIINARYTPVGTVSYSFDVDEEKVDDVFNLNIEYKNNERTKKKLNVLSQSEINKMKQSFHLLDKERVFKTNSFGEPNIFKFSVESIGFMNSDQLVLDSFYILELMLRDILNSIDYTQTDDEIKFTYTDKISIEPSYDELLGYFINIQNENHTIGNLISEYYKALYCRNNTNIITFASYRMPHPLKERIEIKCKLNNSYDVQTTHKELTSELLNRVLPKSHKSKEKQELDIVTIVFMKTIHHILDDIEHVKTQWKRETNIENPSFEILDNESYFNK